MAGQTAARHRPTDRQIVNRNNAPGEPFDGVRQRRGAPPLHEKYSLKAADEAAANGRGCGVKLVQSGLTAHTV
jgi:hypothetical protein